MSKFRFTEQESQRIEQAVALVRRSEHTDRLVSEHDDEGAFDWMEQALCGQTDPNLFILEVGGKNPLPKKICSVCDVAVSCLAYALKHNMRSGVWGGMTNEKLAHIRKLYGIANGNGDVVVEEPTPGDGAAAIDDDYPEWEPVHPLDIEGSVS